jgi:hypothetical protein
MMKTPTILCALIGLLGFALIHADNASAGTIFSDTFESGTAGANLGAPWGADNITKVDYQSANNPFADGTLYADMLDPQNSSSPSVAIRLLSNGTNDTTLSSSISGQVTTLSFDYWEPQRTGDSGALIFGYYQVNSGNNPDLNTAGRDYSATLHDGTLSSGQTKLSGASATYAQQTVNTVWMVTNDTASAVTNYDGNGHDLAADTADIWLSSGGAAPVLAFTIGRQNASTTLTTLQGIGFRTNNADIEDIFVNDLLLTSGATFDRSAVPEPASWLLAVFAGLGLTAAWGFRRRRQIQCCRIEIRKSC